AFVIAVAHPHQKHEHTLGEARVYHVSQDGIYYTRQCNDNYSENFTTQASLLDIMKTMSSQDKIVLTEDIVLDESLTISSVVLGENGPVGLNLNVNIDLNNHQITSNIADDVDGAMFKLSANYGTIKFNIKNGKIYSEDFKYIFDFQNDTTVSSVNKNISLNIDNVECVVKGNNTTPLYANSTAHGIEVNAVNSKFIAQQSTTTDDNTVGVFINSANSRFNFTGCDFEGADGVYVKQGRVNLNKCNLNSTLSTRRTLQETENPFFAIGATLLAESYNSSTGCTQFNVVITDCVATANSYTAIYLIQTNEEGHDVAFNNNSSVVVNSGMFNGNPQSFEYKNSLNENIITYANTPIAENVNDIYMFVVK
ncbi:MAG: hypothetical protein IJA72_01005, partial [Clostridia bacterium]|nr:hypothetical protein [Clostridia bacterium]